MAKAMRNSKRKSKRLLEERSALVKAALEMGNITRKEICKATGLELHDLANLFTRNRELYAEYKIRRRTIADIASDNIMDIVNDPSHPQHFQASKYVLSTYKSELDDVLEDKGQEEIGITVGGESKASPITINFGKKKKEE